MIPRLIVVLFFGLLLAGCTSSTAVDPTPKQVLVANAVEDAIAIGLVPVFTNNPDYVAAADAIASALAVVPADTITPDGVDGFLKQFDIEERDRRVIAGVVVAAWQTYEKRYSQQVSSALRPDVKLFLSAVSSGIKRAVAATPRHD